MTPDSQFAETAALRQTIYAAVHDTIDRCCTDPGERCAYDDHETHRVTDAVFAAVCALLGVRLIDELTEMAMVAWDQGALAFSLGRGSDANPYRQLLDSYPSTSPGQNDGAL